MCKKAMVSPPPLLKREPGSKAMITRTHSQTHTQEYVSRMEGTVRHLQQQLATSEQVRLTSSTQVLSLTLTGGSVAHLLIIRYPGQVMSLCTCMPFLAGLCCCGRPTEGKDYRTHCQGTYMYIVCDLIHRAVIINKHLIKLWNLCTKLLAFLTTSSVPHYFTCM